MLLESQVVLEEQGGFGNREVGASPKLRLKVGPAEGGNDGFKGFPEISSRQPPCVAWAVPSAPAGSVQLHDQFSRCTKVGRAGISVTRE